MRRCRIDDETVDAAVSLLVFHGIGQHLWMPQVAKPLLQQHMSQSLHGLSSKTPLLMGPSIMVAPSMPVIHPSHCASFNRRKHPILKRQASINKYARLREALRGISESQHVHVEGLLEVTLAIIRAYIRA